jgi:Zn-dependent protease
MSAVIHEVSHGIAAFLQGDPTAKNAGRLTLNPINHLDLFGSILLPIIFVITNSPIFFAYAKPVPYNPYNLRNQRWGPALVGLAGPLSNIIIAVIFSFVLRLFNASEAFTTIIFVIIQVNVWLALFNLIPIPPLDGSKLLFSLIPARLYNVEEMLERYGFFVLIFFMFIVPSALFGPLEKIASIILTILLG